MKIRKIVNGIACIVALSACDMDYHEYSNYGKEYMDETYENVIGMITNVYSMLDYDFGQVYSGGMLASACDEAEYAYTNNDICNFTNGSWSPSNPMSNTWTSSYKAIQTCNQYLAEFQGLTFDELKLTTIIVHRCSAITTVLRKLVSCVPISTLTWCVPMVMFPTSPK